MGQITRNEDRFLQLSNKDMSSVKEVSCREKQFDSHVIKTFVLVLDDKTLLLQLMFPVFLNFDIKLNSLSRVQQMFIKTKHLRA
jgi:hypothetical protein